ncbi:MAG: NAD(P)-binding domain-containing protein [Nitrososphaerota archaeon]|nr:NAD(P)-binding domain-containing protein [Nitrososphaerota archaeon]
MKVAVLGGTGVMGKAIAKQLSRSNQVIIGSRDPIRAREAARSIAGAEGLGYLEAVQKADVVVFVIPYSALGEAARLSGPASGKLVISVINPLKMEGGLFKFAKEDGSAAEELALLLPGSRVATAFNNVSSLFFEQDQVVPMDILVAADSKETYQETAKLIRGIPNLRPLYAGPLSEARTIERITPLILNLSRLNKTRSLATRFVETEKNGK